MTELTHQHRKAAPRSRMVGFAWFAAMVGGWVAFYVLMAGSESTLGDLQDRVGQLPFLLEVLVWLVFFPYVLALTIWDSGWSEALRFALVASCAIGWSLAFFPWRKAPTRAARSEP